MYDEIPAMTLQDIKETKRYGRTDGRRSKEDKDQESIQSSTTPDPGYQWESDNVTTRHHK